MQIEDFKRTDARQAFYLETESSVPLLKFHILDQTGIVEHGFTTRQGGVSKGIFSAMNMSYHRGDEKPAVDENYRRAADSLHASAGDFVMTAQTHTVNIHIVTDADRGKGVIKEPDYHDIDGLITNEPGIVLGALFADCVPLFFVDPVHRAIGLSHSGWRGTAARMGRRTLEAMADAYGSMPEDMICAIGPSICQSCYEISEDVAFRFQQEFPDAGRELLYAADAGKYQLNLWKANELVLKEAGVPAQNLAVTNICTCCNADILFSHRASHGKRGNLGAFLKLC